MFTQVISQVAASADKFGCILSGLGGAMEVATPPKSLFPKDHRYTSLISKVAQVAGAALLTREAAKLAGYAMPKSFVLLAALTPFATRAAHALAVKSASKRLIRVTKAVDDKVGYAGQVASLASAVGMLVFGAPLFGTAGVVIGMNLAYWGLRKLHISTEEGVRRIEKRLSRAEDSAESLQDGLDEATAREVVLQRQNYDVNQRIETAVGDISTLQERYRAKCDESATLRRQIREAQDRAEEARRRKEDDVLRFGADSAQRARGDQ